MIRKNQVGQMESVGFYGLDLYSMTTSMGAVLSYLDKIDPKEAADARARYACFGQFINDPQAYGYAIASGIWDSCEQEVITQLIQLQQKARLYIERDGAFAGNEYFSAQQNAELVKNAEEYYRAMFRGRPKTELERSPYVRNAGETRRASECPSGAEAADCSSGHITLI